MCSGEAGTSFQQAEFLGEARKPGGTAGHSLVERTACTAIVVWGTGRMETVAAAPDIESDVES